MIAIIGILIGMFGFFLAAVASPVGGALFLFAGAYLVFKQGYVDDLEEELERRDLGYRPRKMKPVTHYITNWR